MISPLGIYPMHVCEHLHMCAHSYTHFLLFLCIYVHCSVLYSRHNLEATQVPKERWQDKEEVQVHNRYCEALRENGFLPFAITQTVLEEVRLSEISQKKKTYKMVLYTQIIYKEIKYINSQRQKKNELWGPKHRVEVPGKWALG